MPEIKLARLPDRTPVRLTLAMPPDLHRSICAYADYYEAQHGERAQLAELIPAMLESFLSSDKAFGKALREGTWQQKPPLPGP